MLIEAMLDLYEVTMDEGWLEKSISLTKLTIQKFFSRASGMFNFSDSDHDILIANSVEIHDNVVPSSNSVMANNLFRLSRLVHEDLYNHITERMKENIAEDFLNHPYIFSNWGRLMIKHMKPFYEIAIIGEKADEKLQLLMKEYNPNIILAGSAKESKLSIFKDRYTENRTLIYICQDQKCNLPLENPEDAQEQLHIG
jgi:uncharacterized protein YyaL (SSP411 family)